MNNLRLHSGDDDTPELDLPEIFRLVKLKDEKTCLIVPKGIQEEIEGFEAFEVPTANPVYKKRTIKKRVITIYSLPKTEPYMQILTYSSEELCQEHYNRYPQKVERDVFGIFDLCYLRCKSIQKACKMYKLLKNIRAIHVQIRTPICSIYEVDEEDEPDSDSDTESNLQVNKMTPLPLF